MRIVIHIENTDGEKIAQWETTDHMNEIALNDIIAVDGKPFEVVRRRPSFVGDPYGPYDRVIIVYPLDNPT